MEDDRISGKSVFTMPYLKCRLVRLSSGYADIVVHSDR